MSHRSFFVSLAAIVLGGAVYRGWMDERVPDLSAAESLQETEKLLRAGEDETAIRYATAALAKEPRNVRAYELRGIALTKLARYGDALVDLSKAIEFSRGGAHDAFVQRALIFQRAGLFDEALSDVNNALRLAPDDAFSYLLRSMIYDDPKSGDKAKSKQDLEKAVSLAPEIRDDFPSLR